MCKGDKEFLPVTLEAMASYLETARTDVLHPVGLTQLTKKFSHSLKADEQVHALMELGATPDELGQCTNQKQRAALYRELLKAKHC